MLYANLGLRDQNQRVRTPRGKSHSNHRNLHHQAGASPTTRSSWPQSTEPSHIARTGRPDLLETVSALGPLASGPTEAHMRAVIHAAKYLKETSGL